MYPQIRALLWQITYKYRWGILAAGAYLFAATLLSHLLPHRIFSHLGTETLSGIAAVFVGMPFLFIWIMVIAMFGMASPNASGTNFPTHMLVLPVRTSTLTAGPMIAGLVTIMSVWWIVSFLVLRPLGITVAKWSPATGLALFSAAFQALTWTPFAQRWIQFVITLATFGLSIPIVLIGLALDIPHNELIFSATFLALVPIAYLAALSGVAKTRRGDVYDWQLWNRFVAWLASKHRARQSQFASPFRAQLWFEFRTHCKSLPFFIGFVLFCFVPALLLEPANVGVSWKMVATLFGTTLFISSMAGSSLGNMHDPFSKTESSAFVLARPISSVSLVRGKFVAAAVGAVVTWTVIFSFMSLILLRPGFVDSIREMMQTFALWQQVVLLFLAAGFLMAITWKNVAANLWIALTGRNWVAQLNTSVMVGTVFASIGIAFRLYSHPELQATAWHVLPWFIGALLLSKIALAIWIVRRLLDQQILMRSTVARLSGIWISVVTVNCLIVLWLMPTLQLSAVLVAVALSVPYCRLAATPLALNWNRHR